MSSQRTHAQADEIFDLETLNNSLAALSFTLVIERKKYRNSIFKIARILYFGGKESNFHRGRGGFVPADEQEFDGRRVSLPWLSLTFFLCQAKSKINGVKTIFMTGYR